MPSLNIDLGFYRHPKTIRLIHDLGDAGVIALQKLWIFAAEFCAESGDLAGYDPLEIERYADWRGERGALVAALEKHHFLDRGPRGYIIHDWLEHEGHIGAYRQRARTAALSRHGRRLAKRKTAKSKAVSVDATSTATSNASALHCTALHCTAKEGLLREEKPTPPPAPPPPQPEPPTDAGKIAPPAPPPKSVVDVPIPPALDTPAFRAAWADWLDDRKRRRKPVTPKAAELQLAKCAGWGEVKSISAITTAIEKGWQGLWEPDNQQGGSNGQSHAAGSRKANMPGVDRNAGTFAEQSPGDYAGVVARKQAQRIQERIQRAAGSPVGGGAGVGAPIPAGAG